MALGLRFARADDADLLAWTILTAGRAHLQRGWYDIAFGLPEAQCLGLLRRLVVAETPSWWRYDRWLVAEADGVPAGALAVFASGAFASSEPALAETLRDLGWTDADIAQVWARGAYVFSCAMAPAEREAWTIENVAVRPEHRGKGVAGRLIANALELGRSQGFAEAQISFVIGNQAAERAYAKAGFRPAEERRSPEFQAAVGAPGLKRFTQPL